MAQTQTLVDLSGLQWVRGELDQNLERVHQFIDAYLEAPDDKLPLQRTVIELHQARGILAMVRLHGASVLAEELRQAVHDVLHGGADEAVESVFEVVLGGTIQLSDYLDFIQSETTDSALIFHPLINELRVARGKPVINESDLFVRFLQLEPPQVELPALEGRDSAEVSSQAATFQKHFDAALLGVLRDQDSTANFLRLGKIAQQLLQVISAPGVYQQWLFAEAVFESLSERGLEVGLEIKRLLGKLGLQLKHLAREGQDSPNAVDRELTYSLLYFVGRSTTRGTKVEAVRGACQLDELLPTAERLEGIRERLRGPNTSLLQTLSVEIRKDLGMVKDNLDLLLRAGDKAPDRLDETVATIKRVATTLDMLGMTALQRVVERQGEIIDRRRHEAEPDQREWLEAAVALLWVEHSLDELLFRHVHPDAALEKGPQEEPGEESISPRELKEGSASILREALINIARIKEMTSVLVTDEAEENVGEVAGLLNEASAALRMMGSEAGDAECVEQIRDYVLNPAFPLACRSEEKLGRFAEAVSSLEVYLLALQDRQSNARKLLDNCKSYVAELSLPESVSEDAAEQAEQPVAPVLVVADDVDPEIREIFLEEVDEIKDMLAANVPSWSKHTDNKDALGDIRRAFHTLKGSGRMVGATAIGDYGWAVEQVLNHCLEGSLQIDAAVVSLVNDASTHLNELVDAFAGGEAFPSSARQVIIDAHKITGTEPPASISVASGQEGEQDDLWSIFSKDALNHLEHLQAFLAQGESDGKGPLVSAELVRAFHTLKSGARVVGLGGLSRLSGDMEELCDTIRATGRPLSSEAFGLVAKATAVIDTVMSSKGDMTAVKDEVVAIHSGVEDLLGDMPTEGATDLELMVIFTDEACDLLNAVESTLEDWVAAPREPRFAETIIEHIERFAETADTAKLSALVMVVQEMLRLVRDWQHDGITDAHAEGLGRVISGLYDLLDRLRQGIKVDQAGDLLAQLQQLSELEAPVATAPPISEESGEDEVESAALAEDGGQAESAALEDFAVDPGQGFEAPVRDEDNGVESETAPEPEMAVEVADEASLDWPTEAEVDLSEDLSGDFKDFNQPETAEPAVEAPVAEASPMDEELFALFAEEAEEILDEFGHEIDHWEQEPTNPNSSLNLMRLLHTLKGSARMAGATHIGNLSHDLEDELINRTRIDEPGDEALFAHLRDISDQMHAALSSPQAAVTQTSSVQDEVAEPAPAIEPETLDVDSKFEEPQAEDALAIDPDALDFADEGAPWPSDGEYDEAGEELEDGLTVEGLSADLDTLSEGVDSMLASLGESAPENISETGSEAESLPEAETVTESTEAESAPEVESIIETPDIVTGGPEETVPMPVEETPAVTDSEIVKDSVEPAVEAESPEPIAEKPDPVAATAAPAGQDRKRPATISDTARVAVTQLDRMFNEAGEVGIYLGRMEKQQADLRAHLKEMAQAIGQMRERIRQLDIETENQMQTGGRRGTGGEDDRYTANFDPLEMDRYTRMNELSRSLNESAADLVSLQSLMEEVNSSNETLILQQGRITSNLQHGLMNTMVVPFAGVTQRLQRTIRQSCQSSGKRARLDFIGADAELDRNVLERMIGPLEHLLRNAVAHGIEAPEDREKASKPMEGRITVELRRDGTQSIIEVSDDGKGLDIPSIRKTAIEKKLISETAKLSDLEMVQMIFEPGFSTASTLTHEAGRGVGMDIVNAEIKQLGGNLSVSFTPGKGSMFQIRIPSSLALTQALLVRVRHESYAIGMAGIDGIERLPRDELPTYLAEDGPRVHYGGSDYRAIRLEDLVNPPLHEQEEEESLNVPVLLMRAGDEKLALVVDQVIGSEEFVVKSLGPQVSAIPGVSGGTLLADGSVVLIIDVPTLYQTRHRRVMSVDVHMQAGATVKDERPLIMVVDDSITIRRVTERFLGRHGYRIETAKDGMDALPKLQAETPSVVLLDVEMPRIDGFEVATYMKNNDSLKDVPIIMITSRSGEKHRKRAADIGVDRYLVKPYQEDDLLSNIESVMHQGKAE